LFAAFGCLEVAVAGTAELTHEDRSPLQTDLVHQVPDPASPVRPPDAARSIIEFFRVNHKSLTTPISL